MAEIIFDFKVKKMNGDLEDLSVYKNNVLLIVNTASQCGFTPQYEDLEIIYKKYKDQGFAILGFPCNQFGGQEPGTDQSIKEFCETIYHITFPLYSKVEVKGENAEPLFKYLTQKLPGILGMENIKWNFTKFLINKHGLPFKRYAPQDNPRNIEKDIESLLKC